MGYVICAVRRTPNGEKKQGNNCFLILLMNILEREAVMELKGSQTEKNLLAGFAGESQARNRYTYFEMGLSGGG